MVWRAGMSAAVAVVALMLAARSGGGSRPSRGAGGFDVVARRVLRSVQHRDWNALRPDLAPTVTFADYRRLYESSFRPEELQEFNGYLFRSGEEASRYTAALLAVPTGRALDNVAARTFERFCDLVIGATSTPPFRPQLMHFGATHQLPELFGPAVDGKVASNLDWRIEMERSSGRWRAARFVTAMH